MWWRNLSDIQKSLTDASLFLFEHGRTTVALGIEYLEISSHVLSTRCA